MDLLNNPFPFVLSLSLSATEKFSIILLKSFRSLGISVFYQSGARIYIVFGSYVYKGPVFLIHRLLPFHLS